MSIEIELKYLISEQSEENEHVASKITNMLKVKNIDFSYVNKQLSNDYFDSQNLDLRKMDMGLRIRSQDHKYEQTIKTAGKVINGLHKRPEYNVDIESSHLALTLFPEHIWPENVDVNALQKKLQVIFTTNFTRQAWLIRQNESVIELALDRGTINTTLCQQELVINELELELVKGEQEALFELAEQLKTIITIEPGNLSKAARGYSLYNNQ